MYFVYIMTNVNKTVLYTGVTNDLQRRIYEHRNGLSGFSSRYRVSQLVYYEMFDDVEFAILREKQIKGGSRVKKVRLIETTNPEWEDLVDTLG